MSFATFCRDRAKGDSGMATIVAELPSEDWDYETAIGILAAKDPYFGKRAVLVAAREDFINETEGRIIKIDPTDPLIEAKVESLYVEDILIEPTDESLAARMPEVRALLSFFYEAFVEKGTVNEYGELEVDPGADMIWDVHHTMERFMQGKPVYPTREEHEEEFRRFRIQTERWRLRNLKDRELRRANKARADDTVERLGSAEMNAPGLTGEDASGYGELLEARQVRLDAMEAKD